jgi:lipoprotein-releasing system permease protein
VYKLLLCLRYLRTRYLAFVCIGSVMLGVATLIVVNSVMAGFSDKLKSHLNGLSSDVTIRTEKAEGFVLETAEIERQLTASAAGKHVEAVSPTVETFALMQFTIRTRHGPESFVKHVKVIAIDPERHSKVGKFAEYLQGSKGDPAGCFRMTDKAKERFDHHRWWEALEAAEAERQREWAPPPPPAEPGKNPFGQPTPKLEGGSDLPPELKGLKPQLPAPVVDAVPPTPPGIVLGWDIGVARFPDPDTGEMKDYPLLQPGDDVFLATVGASGSKPVSATFVVTDYFRSRYGEYDANIVYVPLEDLQKLRGMDQKANCLQLRLTPDVRENPQFVHSTVVPAAQAIMPVPEAHAESWWQQQGSLLSAIDIERSLLNILLFLIIGVAGFGVLAIFSMIVKEKYRDIGVMKSLGASGGGVMGIFLGYGLLLGLVGGVLGTALGVWITENINAIEKALAAVSGQQIFDRKVYSFDSIPTHLDAVSVVLVNLGAIAIAVASAVLPALRAARLQPVQALRRPPEPPCSSPTPSTRRTASTA